MTDFTDHIGNTPERDAKIIADLRRELVQRDVDVARLESQLTAARTTIAMMQAAWSKPDHTERDAALRMVKALVDAFPELRTGMTGAVQQRVLREARALLDEYRFEEQPVSRFAYMAPEQIAAALEEEEEEE